MFLVLSTLCLKVTVVVTVIYHLYVDSLLLLVGVLIFRYYWLWDGRRSVSYDEVE